MTLEQSQTGGRIILRVDSGVDHGASISRQLADTLLERLVADGDVVIYRDVTGGIPLVDPNWHAAVFAGADPEVLTLSEDLVHELLSADELVLVAPIYNFGRPR